MSALPTLKPRRCGHTIVTEYIYPPIPTRTMDWRATLDDYEPGARMGWGATEQAAIADLLEALEDA